MSSNQEETTPAHLPPPWPDQDTYDQFCQQVHPAGDYTEAEIHWNEIRIRPGTTAEAVYRRLPSDLDVEYGGYLTKTGIRYAAFDPHRAWVPQSKSCTFHSHPTKIQRLNPDLPSAADIRQFLLGRHWRTISVGRFRLWVWDKTQKTRESTRKLWEWESQNMVTEVDRIRARHSEGWEMEFFQVAIRQIGVRIPENPKYWERTWVDSLTTKLGLIVTVLERDGEIQPASK